MRCSLAHKNEPATQMGRIKRVSYIQMNFCADCNDLAYKIRDDVNEQNGDSYEKHLKEWEKEQKANGNIFGMAASFLTFLGKNTNKDNE